MPFNRDRLKNRRIDMGITLQEVADNIGVEKPTVQRYESGKINKIDTVTVEKLASAVKCSPAYLMGWQDTIQFEKILGSGLDKNEQSLISTYRNITPKGQKVLLETAETLYNNFRSDDNVSHNVG